jgi:hypothetical protein
MVSFRTLSLTSFLGYSAWRVGQALPKTIVQVVDAHQMLHPHEFCVRVCFCASDDAFVSWCGVEVGSGSELLHSFSILRLVARMFAAVLLAAPMRRIACAAPATTTTNGTSSPGHQVCANIFLRTRS